MKLTFNNEALIRAEMSDVCIELSASIVDQLHQAAVEESRAMPYLAKSSQTNFNN